MTGDEQFTFDDASQPNAALLFVVRKRHEHAILIIDAYALYLFSGSVAKTPLFSVHS